MDEMCMDRWTKELETSIAFRDSFIRMTKEMDKLEKVVQEMDEVNREQYCKAACVALNTMLDRLGGCK